jgi:hypothetical protein
LGVPHILGTSIFQGAKGLKLPAIPAGLQCSIFRAEVRWGAGRQMGGPEVDARREQQLRNQQKWCFSDLNTTKMVL